MKSVGCNGCEFYTLIPTGELAVGKDGRMGQEFILACKLGECKYEGGREEDDRDDMF